MSELKHAESEKVRQWHGRTEQESAPLAVVHDLVGIVAISSLMAAARRHYTQSTFSSCSALELVVRTEIEKDPYHNVWLSEEKREEAVNNLSVNQALQSRLEQCISETCSTNKYAVQDMLLELLGYAILLSRNCAAGGINSG